MKAKHGLLPLRRSLLATPGNVPSKVQKALQLPVDVLMLDLEDGVPNTDSAKARARAVLKEALGSGQGFVPREIAVRINGPRTQWFLDDIHFVVASDLKTVVIPMVYDAADLEFAERCLRAAGASEALRLILLIETPAGVLNLPEIVKASPRITGLIGGGLDYAAAMQSLSILPLPGDHGGRPDDDLIYMRQRILAVGRAHGLSVLDAMRPSLLADMESFRADARRARWLGFDGVDFFHPGFIEIANEVFSPTTEELDWARRVLDATASRQEDAPASAKIDGRVILPQHIEIAHRFIAQAQQIAGR